MGVCEYAVLAQGHRLTADRAGGGKVSASPPLRHLFKKAVTPFDFDGHNCFGRSDKGLYTGAPPGETSAFGGKERFLGAVNRRREGTSRS
jgi:hypothetical protein